MYISPGIERRILGRLSTMIERLPPGAAKLMTGENPTLEPKKNLFPYFRVAPANPRSASIEGYIYEGQGIDFKIGEAIVGEIYVSPKEKTDSIEEDKFFRICHATFTTHFSEELIYSPSNRVIWSRMVLDAGGRKVRLSGHQIFWWLVPGRTTKNIRYEPYY